MTRALCLMIVLGGCGVEPLPLPDDVSATLDLPSTPYSYTDELPAHFQTPFVRDLDNTPADNPIGDDGATLGRVLFYDPALSSDSTIACASCHPQGAAFADPDRFSAGLTGQHTTRNAMGIADARFYRAGRFFWDERAATLEAQVLLPIQNTVEMGLTLDELVARVEATPYYAFLFERAFGDGEVTTDRIARALAQFVRSIVSYRARYDVELAIAGDIAAPFAGFTAEENAGKALFLSPRTRCAGCHLDAGPPRPGPRLNQAAFFIDIATSNGLDETTAVTDLGVGAITTVPRDLGRFKSPSLRNIALTGPYMHDGRMASLEEVVRHYSTGVKAHPNLDPRLRDATGAPRRLDLTDDEIAALVAFLGTLTDDALLDDPRFADPFRDHAP